MTDLSAVWVNVPECHLLCELTEGAVGKLEYHYLAALIYLAAIAAVAMSVLKRDYFKKNYTNKLYNHKVNSDGVNTVWRFSAIIVSFNAVLHAAQIFEIALPDHGPILDHAPIEALGWLTWFWIVWGVGNIVFWMWLARGYIQDAAKADGFEKKKALLIIYFTPVAVLWVFDDTFSKNWDFFKLNHVLEWALSNLQNGHGWGVIVTVFLFLVLAVVVILLEILKQEWVHKKWWQFLVNVLVPFALPITAVLAISLAGAAFFFSGGGNANVAASASTPREAPVQSAAPVKRVAAPLFD